jgi:hypothetical protein
MKIFATILAALSLLSFSAEAQFTPTARNVKVEKISTNPQQKSPEFSMSRTTDKRAEYLNWLEIEVEFSVDIPANVDVIDELTFDYIIEINGKLCPGSVTHVNIPKGKNLFSVMYMSPRSIHRLTGGKDLTAAGIGNVWVSITKNGGLISKKSDKAGEPVATKPRQTGLLVQKAETPFAALWWDRYEAVKPGAR